MRPLVALVLCLLVLGAVPAQAETGDCDSPAYMAQFPDAASAADIACVELFRENYTSPEGPRVIRGISDAAANWAVTPGIEAGVERGVRAAISALGQLGTYRIDDVTILLLDDTHSFDGPEVLAETDGRRDRTGGRPGECLITLYSLVGASAERDMAVTTAHEIFHCVQYASFSQAKMNGYDDSAAWWIEGSAEWFASLAVDDSGPATDRGAAFDDKVSAHTPLYAMAHEAVVFFDWLMTTRAPSALIPFLNQMAESGSVAAQRAAMRAALSQDDWRDFSRAYAGANITQPWGDAVTLSPAMSDTINVTRTQTHHVSAGPFTLELRAVEYDCGTWGNTVSPGQALVSVTQAFSSDWGDWPDEIDTRAGAGSSYDMVAFQTGDAKMDISVRIEQRRTCQPCAGSDAVDACLVGTWQMTGGGPVEWMKSQGLPITHATEGPRIVTYLSSGAYGTEPVSGTLDMADDRFTSHGAGATTVATGRWSAAEGTLNICQDSGGLTGQVRVTTDAGSHTMPVSKPGAGTISMAYSCAGDSLQTSMHFPGLPDMVTEYGKIASELP
ncbi:MAG: hypothetical protein GC146_13205 [Limimaricola sp.]|uniref:hypothetical protein n=1 Tax=Limimaricola sp. TaxID=2211665 RepID=UPI001D542816|nr:hypothetical protein [Limimaricola sp.]MBI1418173.1 hypothetical protein [Limimaricola sp.]